MQPDPRTRPQPKISGLLIMAYLLMPGIASTITLFSFGGSDYGVMSGLVLLCGAIVGGLSCGVHVASCKTHSEWWVRLLIGIGLTIMCGGAAILLGVGGCSVALEFANIK